MRPEVVILDVNGTLSDMGPLATCFERLGVGAEMVATWFSNTLRDGFGLTAAGAYADFSQVAESAAVALLGGRVGLRIDARAAAAQVMAAMAKLPVHDDVPAGLEGLRHAGLRLVMLTNGSRSNAAGLLERAGVSGLVEQILSVEEVGRWKPAPEPYRHAVACCGVEPGQAMLAAVHPWDVDGAGRAGLPAAWINRGGQTYPSALRQPAMVAGDLVSLASALASGG